MTRERILLLGEGALTAAFLGAGLTAVLTQPTWSHGAHLLVGLAFASVAFVLAFVVVRHAPGNLVGPILGAVGLVAVLTAATDVYSYVAADGDLPLSPYVVAFGQGIWMLLYLPFAALLLWFPDGRLPGPRWRWVPVGFVVVVVLFNVALGFGDEPYLAPFEDLPPPVPTYTWAFPAAVALLPVLMGLLVACVAAAVVRSRRADAVERQQLRWLLLASGSLPLTLLLCWLSYLVLGTADLVVVGLAFMYVAFPVAAAIAVVRHDLYDVDRAVVLAAVYAVLGAGLLLAFTVASVAAGLVAGGGSTAVALVVTAGCGVLLGGQRGRLTHVVGTRLYPARERARAAIAGLRDRVHAGDAVPEQLEPTLRGALGDPELRVGHVAPHLDFCVDRDGREVELDDGWEPVTLAGHRAGVLVPGRPTPRWLLHYVAGEAALLVETARLRLELAHALQQVEASRERLVRASDDERKRLELDLHDGAQQRLVSLGMSLRLAQRHLGDGTVDVDAVIDGAVAELGTAVSELRQIAHGLRPSCLDDGLATALVNLTRGVPVLVSVDVRAGDLPEHVSTTAYYVASEAVANAVKHASAQAIGLTVEEQDGSVRVMVSDDGRGGAEVRPGSGLAGLRDRVQAVGGRLGVLSGPGGGTVVEAVLPCGS